MNDAEVRKNLREIGCPYVAEDFRAKLWLEGYRAGFNASHKNAIDSLNAASVNYRKECAMNAETKVKAASLSAAMAKAFGEIEAATKSATNPHFKSKYADLGAIIEAVKPPLIKHGLFFTQRSHPAENGVSVETVLHHEGGEELSLGTLFVPANKQDAQGFGSALTYARRYGLMTAFGVPAEDDDGNAAAASAPKAAAANRPVPIEDNQRDLIAQLAPAVGKTVQSICEAYRVASLKELTYTQAESVIARLRAPAKQPENA